MNNDLIMKAITLSGEEKKVINGSTVISIKDEKGLKYSFWEKKQDGSFSKAYEGYQKFSLGDTVEIYYSEEHKTNKEGKAYTARGIAYFGDKVPTTPASVESPRSEAPTASQVVSGDAFGRRLGVQGHINALLSNPNVYNNDGRTSIPGLVTLAIQVEDEAEKQLNPSTFRQAIQKHAPQVVEELPVIQQGEDLSVEDIPFS
jgi:hypothetical protein